jgi:hypothetical protein
VFAVLVKISILPKSFLLLLINNAMRITEIIEPKFQEQPVTAEPVRKRRFQDIQLKQFQGTVDQWRDRVRELVPSGANIVFTKDSSSSGATPDEKVWVDGRIAGRWSDKNGGTGTVPVPTSLLGSGAYAGVQQTQDPFTVRKKNTSAFDRSRPDAYMAYVHTIRKLMAQNPFFPRVYNIRVQKHNKLQRPSYDTERLYSYQDLDYETLAGLTLRYFPELEAAVSGSQNPHTTWAILTMDVEQLAKTIWNQLRARHFSKIPIADLTDLTKMQDMIPGFVEAMQQTFSDRDPQLIEALTVIVCVASANPNTYGLDMHTGNSMIRFTPAGPQLVFTDPLT